MHVVWYEAYRFLTDALPAAMKGHTCRLVYLCWQRDHAHSYAALQQLCYFFLLTQELHRILKKAFKHNIFDHFNFELQKLILSI